MPLARTRCQIVRGGISLGGDNNLIGGTNAGAGNVVSGNLGAGINSSSAISNIIQGNIIGLDPTGTRIVGNGGDGVSLIGGLGSNNVVGGTSPGARNVISGNRFSGIFIGNVANVIQGNFIGTDITGTIPLGNGDYGVQVGVTLGYTVLGGSAPGAGNLIAGNTNFGVNLGGASISNVVQGNLIGTDVTGNNALPNSRGGMRLFTTRRNLIGGSAPGEGNRIAFNGGPGITIEGGNDTNNAVRGNSIFGNVASIFSGNIGLGIDLGVAGVRANDACDLDTGPNYYQNFPVLTNVIVSLAGLTIQGLMPGASNGTYTLDFFANAICDPSGYGEGQTFLGSTSVTTDGICAKDFAATFAPSTDCHFYATAIATDTNGNSSEFSACRQAMGVDTDGDGLCDVEEVLAGTDPNQAASVLRITAIAREGEKIRVSWQAGGGRTNILQTTTGTVAGGVTNNFIDLPPQVVLPGTGDVFTDRLHIGGGTNRAGYYRVRLVR